MYVYGWSDAHVHNSKPDLMQRLSCIETGDTQARISPAKVYKATVLDNK
jgi:hypothetical protein